MRNKILVELIVPDIEERYDVFLPVSKKIGEITFLLMKSVSEFTNGVFVPNNKRFIYNGDSGKIYDSNLLLYNTDIRNGTKIVLI